MVFIECLLNVTTAAFQDSIEDTILASSMSSLQSLMTKSLTWDTMRTATTSDTDMHTLQELTTTVLPESKNEYPASICDYHQFRNNLYTVDGVIIYKDRIVIPPALRPEVLSSLHAAHKGVSSMIVGEPKHLYSGLG